MYLLSAQSCPTLCNPHGLQPTRFLCSWKFPGKNTGMGCHFLLQKIFLTQGSNLRLLSLLHWQTNPIPLNHLGSYEWRSKWKFKVEIYRERERCSAWFLVCSLFDLFFKIEKCQCKEEEASLTWTSSYSLDVPATCVKSGSSRPCPESAFYCSNYT